jgi:abortive infection bacteriophage resistance protein
MRWWRLAQYSHTDAPRRNPAKRPHTFGEQVQKLSGRGMHIADVEAAKHHLAHINYYRLRGYWMSSELPSPVAGDHAFRPGTDFNAIIDLYGFDRHLRLGINDAIERVEVSVRTRWAHVLATHFGTVAHRHLEPFDDKKHPDLIDRLERHYKARNEIFLKHYLSRGEEPPIWVMCEILSLGDLSRWLGAILHRAVRQEIADTYDMDEVVLTSFIQHLAYVRNVCAHHGRLWNWDLTKRVRLPKQPRELGEQLNRRPPADARIYNTLTLLAWMVDRISPESDWIERTRELVDSQPSQWEAMGFPDDWKTFPLWQSKQ